LEGRCSGSSSVYCVAGDVVGCSRKYFSVAVNISESLLLDAPKGADDTLIIAKRTVDWLAYLVNQLISLKWLLTCKDILLVRACRHLMHQPAIREREGEKEREGERERGPKSTKLIYLFINRALCLAMTLQLKKILFVKL
jgi:hypothetical protein